ncbi:MAG: alpha-glucosidase [Ignavibacteria bacterium RIFOXYD12_FULL_36_8]|nr:MAG: alpha-glucosidase [Ignavibacteria bacterium RIFOXYD12_FULL_36_8]
MKKMIITLIAFYFGQFAYSQSYEVTSPGNVLKLSFKVENAIPYYWLSRKNKVVIKPSRLGFLFNDVEPLNGNFKIKSTTQNAFDETWTQVWGEQKFVRNNYKELKVSLIEDSKLPRSLDIVFRVFDDGIGFRYEFPVQDNLQYFVISEELSEFALTGNHKAFWIPGDYDSQEYTYSTSKLSEIDASIGSKFSEIEVKSLIDDNFVQTPLMMKTEEGLHINIHEAALLDYPAMHLTVDKKNYKLQSQLAPDAYGNKAYLQTPCKTPWRTIIVSDRAEDILASKIILNLNEPNKIEDVSWIRPQKYVGIWWEMHVGYSTWNYSDLKNVTLKDMDWNTVKPNGKHGATTQRTKRYIDFAAEHGFDAVLVEGWNVGWEDWFGNWKEEVFDFVTPYPDFNVEELSNYAKKKGVKLIMHHETSSSVTNYERRIDEAFNFMKKYGYDAVKTGYVGKIIPRGEHHDSQWMINHFTRVVEKAADKNIMINSHESVRPTGLSRTYPNWLSSEAARGNEFNAWSIGNPPEHETILPFTRLMGGPMDYTPGIFQIKMDYYDKNKKEHVHSTLAKQLALYVTMYSPLQMAADLPENYERFPDVFQFIKDVPVDWHETKILAAEPGDYIITARKERDGENWFIGAITDEQGREFNLNLDFLDEDKNYSATMYLDSENSDWKDNPISYQIKSMQVDKNSKIKLHLAPGGGAAITFAPHD